MISRLTWLLCSLLIFSACCGCGSRASTESSRLRVGRLLAEGQYQAAYELSSAAIESAADDLILLELHADACSKLELFDEEAKTLRRLAESSGQTHLVTQHGRIGNHESHDMVAIDEALAAWREPISSAQDNSSLRYEQQAPPSRTAAPKLSPTHNKPHSIATLTPKMQQKELEIQNLIAPEYDPRLGWQTLPLNEPPEQIVKTDLQGLGYFAEYIPAPSIPTTGRSPMLSLLDNFERRQSLVSNAPPQRIRAAPCISAGFRARPTRRPEIPRRRSTQFQCGDNRDNNGNQLTDRDDPACWEIPGDPSSYSRYREEQVSTSPTSGSN